MQGAAPGRRLLHFADGPAVRPERRIRAGRGTLQIAGMIGPEVLIPHATARAIAPRTPHRYRNRH